MVNDSVSALLTSMFGIEVVTCQKQCWYSLLLLMVTETWDMKVMVL